MPTDSASHLVYLSGEFVPTDEAKISIFDAAVMLGDMVTESTRTFAHRPFKLDQHIDRLYKSLKVTRIDPGMTPAEMYDLSLRVLETNLPKVAPEMDVWLVHNISRGRSVAGADPTRQRSPATVIIHTAPLILTDWARFFSEGCHAVTPFSRAVPPEALDARIKNRSRMAYTLAEIEVKLVDPQAQGILLDIHGNVAENKGGNFFIYSEGVLKTPRARSALDLPEYLKQAQAKNPARAQRLGRDQSCDGAGIGGTVAYPPGSDGFPTLRYLHRRRSILYQHPLLHHAGHQIQRPAGGRWPGGPRDKAHLAGLESTGGDRYCGAGAGPIEII